MDTSKVHLHDAFYNRHNNINSYYVDGISITHGNPRQHVWTYAAGIQETLFIQMVNGIVLVPPVVHEHLLHLLVMLISVSLVVQDIMT